MTPARLPDVALTTPLADYFFIAGIESSQVVEEKLHSSGLASPPPEPVDETIEENEVLETDANLRPKSGEGINGFDSSKRKSWRFSFEARKSISSVMGVESKSASNRSSVTIKGPSLENGEQLSGSALNSVDFDAALRKFASERESFLEEIQFSAGTIPQPTKPKPRPKTQRIISDDNASSSLMTGVGSIRRRISTMNSLKRQPTVMRQGTSISIEPFPKNERQNLSPVRIDDLRGSPYSSSHHIHRIARD